MTKPAHAVPDSGRAPAARPTVPSGLQALRGPAPIAFGKGRIGQLSGTSLVVWDPTALDKAVATLVPSPPPQAVGALADGSLAVVSPRQICVLPPAERQPDCASKLTVIPYGTMTRVWGSLDALWIVEVDVARKSHFRAGGQVEELGEEQKLGKPALAAMAPLSDGRVAWTNDIELIAGPATWAAPTGLGINHVAEGPAGSAWVSLSDGTVALISLGARPEKVRGAAVGRVISLAGSVSHVAAVVADAKGEATLVVLGADGKEVLRAVSPFQGRAEDLYVALSPFAPLVAVGGASRLAIWDLATGKLLGTSG